jgi:UDP-glucose 4-epimerase
VPAGAEFVEADIGSGEAAILVREGRFDVVSHLAAQIDVRKSISDPVFDASVNVLGTLNLLEALRSSGSRPRFVFSSTGGAIYGDFVTPPNVETMSKDPESPYGIAKLSAELYIASYTRLYGVDGVALRYANVYGPRQDPHGEAGVVAIFCNRILEKRALTVFGDGGQTRDYVYVGDVARANLAAAERALPAPAQLDTRAFNIGTGIETSVITLAGTLRSEAGSDVSIDNVEARKGELRRSAVNIAKAAEILDWRPETRLGVGLRRTFAWFAERFAAGKA